MASIKVINAQRAARLPNKKLQTFAEGALQLCLREPSVESELKRLAAITIILVSDRRIASLHRKFMHIAGPTDVITFQHGEIFVSVEAAKRNARQFRTSMEDEVRLYIVHGLLHLHGFDDTSAGKARLMERVQRRIVAAANEQLSPTPKARAV